MKNSLLQELGINLNLLLSGFFGALLFIRKEGKSWQENVMILLTGSFTATYVAPFVVELLNIKSTNALSFFGFIVGFGSITIVEYLINKFFKSDDSTTK